MGSFGTVTFQIDSNMLQEINEKIPENRLNKEFLKVKRLEKCLYMDVFNTKKHIEDKCDNIGKRHGN